MAYENAAVAEVMQLVTRTVDSAKSPASVAHCGTQAVLAPQAICQ